MSYEQMWNDLKAYVTQEISNHANGGLMSLSEATWGEINFRNMLKNMEKLEGKHNA